MIDHLPRILARREALHTSLHTGSDQSLLRIQVLRTEDLQKTQDRVDVLETLGELALLGVVDLSLLSPRYKGFCRRGALRPES